MSKGTLQFYSKEIIKNNIRYIKFLFKILLLISSCGLIYFLYYIFIKLIISQQFNNNIIVVIYGIILLLFLLIISINGITSSRSVAIYSKGILLPSKKYMIMYKNENDDIVEEIKFNIFGGFRKFIYYNEIKKITYQKDINSDEIKINPLKIEMDSLKEIPNDLLFISLYTKGNKRYFIFQPLIESFKIKRIVKQIFNFFNRNQETNR